MRARLIGRAQGRAETIRKLSEIAVGDEGVAQSLLLLFGERQQSRLANGARLDPAGDGEVGGERRPAVRRAGKRGDRSKPLKDGHVGCGLRVGPGAAQHQSEKADPEYSCLHGAAPSGLDCLAFVERFHYAIKTASVSARRAEQGFSRGEAGGATDPGRLQTQEVSPTSGFDLRCEPRSRRQSPQIAPPASGRVSRRGLQPAASQSPRLAIDLYMRPPALYGVDLLAATAARLANPAMSSFKPLVLDQRQSFVRSDPLNHPLLDLRPGFALSLDEQRKHPDLATDPNAIRVERLVIGEEANRLSPDPAPHARLFESLPRRRLGRPQSFDRPALGNDPLSRLARGDEEELQRRVGRETIRKRAILQSDRALHLPFAYLARDLRFSSKGAKQGLGFVCSGGVCFNDGFLIPASAFFVEAKVRQAARRSQVHLCLHDEREDLFVLRDHAGLPDLGSLAAMDQGRAANHGRTGRRGGDEIGFALERRRSPGVGGQIDEGGGRAQRVGEAHDRPAVGDAAQRAEVRPDRHPRGEGIRLGADEFDSQQLGEWKRIGVDAVDQRHAPFPWA